MKKVLAIILMALAVTAVFVSCDDPKHEHSYDVNDWKSDSNNHWHVCTTCNEKLDVAEHTFGDWTLSEDGTQVIRLCTVCKYKEIKTVSTWDGTSDTSWYSSDKTEFTLTEASQLAGLAGLVNKGNTFEGKTVKLSINIDLNNEDWTPIGDSSRSSSTNGPRFKGTFDGQNHSVYNITVSESEDDMPSGFFGSVEGATIKNLIIGGKNNGSGKIEYDGKSKISGDEDASAGVVGFILGSGVTTIDNCTNYAKIEGADPAGIVGRAYNSGDGSSTTIKNCVNYGDITGNKKTNQKAGGILVINNTNSKTTVSNCQNYGKVTGNNHQLGGIVGYGNIGLTINDCTNNGEVANNNSERYGGGIVGYIAKNSSGKVSVIDCLNTAEISGTGMNGGITGFTACAAEVKNCKNNGAVSGGNGAGGIAVALQGGTLTKCTNTAAVKAEKEAGGVVGNWNVGGKIDSCNGGSSTIQVTDSTRTAGRVAGNVATAFDSNPLAELIISEDDSSMNTIGMLCEGTQKATLVISSGTVRNLPAIPNDGGDHSSNTIIFKKGVTLYDSSLTNGKETFTVDTTYTSGNDEGGNYKWTRSAT